MRARFDESSFSETELFKSAREWMRAHGSLRANESE